MPPRCKLCNHESREQIDLALRRGVSFPTISRAYGVTVANLQRHKKNHLKSRAKSKRGRAAVDLLAKITGRSVSPTRGAPPAVPRVPVEHGDELLVLVEGLRQDIAALRQLASARGTDPKTQVAARREIGVLSDRIARTLEAHGRVTGRIGDGVVVVPTTRREEPEAPASPPPAASSDPPWKVSAH